MAVNKVVYGQTTLIDLTADTVAPQYLAEGYTAHDRSGALITGTAIESDPAIWQDANGYIHVSDTAEVVEVYADDDGYVVLDVESEGGLDLPVFEPIPNTTSATCNKTYSECLDLYLNGIDAAYAELYNEGALVFSAPLQVYQSDSNGITYVMFDNGVPAGSLIYYISGYIELFNDIPTVDTLTVTRNATYSGGLWNEVDVDVALQSKTVTPTETLQTITPDTEFYDGLSQVTVNGISSTYVGSGIARRSASDLYVYGATVAAPQGYYPDPSNIAQVAIGTAGTPTATKGSVSNHSVSVTPSVTNTTGYITGGTNTGTAVIVSASELVSGTLNITHDGTVDVTNYASVSVNVQGGGSDEDTGPLVKFIDYDGTLLHTYAVDDFKALSSMPSNPSHSGLVSQGWNWSLADAKAQLTAMPDAGLTIGQMYATQSGKSEIDVVFDDADFLSPYLTVCPNGTITVDWGDGSATETMSGSSYTTLKYLQHEYAQTGSYTITLDGNVAFYSNGTSYPAVLRDTAAMNSRRVYAGCVRAVRVGESAKVGQNAFCYLVNLEKVTLPHEITSIGSYVFSTCHALKSITIPDDVTSIGTNALYSCYCLGSVALPAGITTIAASAFSGCYILDSVTLPDGVTSIGTNAFQNCHALKSITLPDGVTSIGTSMFNSCYALETVNIPDEVTSIGNYAFNSCHVLKSVTIPDGVTSIGTYAFQNCYTLETVNIPDDVTSIGMNAFASCYVLKSVTIPDGVTSIDPYVFYNCYTLETVNMPDDATSIGNYAFSGCSTLKSVTIPDGVTSIGAYAFNNCNALETVNMSDDVTSIGTNAFYNCSDLKSVTIPDGITAIAASAFSGCNSLKSVTIPDGVTSIGTNAFNFCYSVLEYHLLPTTPPTLSSSGAFSGLVSGTVIYVPAASLSDYQTADYWSTYASYMVGE